MMKKYISVVIISIILIFTLGGCETKKNIDKECMSNISGVYHVVEQDNGNDADYVGGWWVLFIGDYDGPDYEGPYFTIYDSCGNPGVEGPIISLNEDEIQVDCSEIQDELPSAHWKLDGNTLVVNYKIIESAIELTNENFPIIFNIDED